MKSSVLILLLFISLGFKSFADCSSNGLYAFPESGTIKKTSIFVLDGYARSQNVINELNGKFPVYLQSGDERIPLKVMETHTGQFSMTQAVLKPEKPLNPGKKYLLVVEGLSEGEQFGTYNLKTHQYNPIWYLVSDESDTQAPQWISKPKEKNKSLEHFGCGPSIHVNFSLKVKDQSGYLIKTTVKSVETGKETVYCILDGKEGISIGHGMCAGAFDFEDGINYRAKFAILDASGNVSEETEWVAFTKPLD